MSKEQSGNLPMRILKAPLADYMALLDGVARTDWRRWLALGLGVIAGWWLYVPLHELLHALGCIVAGGEVSRLEIATVYGGDLLADWIPWVAAGSVYAGQLTGFDTRDSDFIYLATVLAPYLLTVFPGVWLLRRGASLGSPGLAAMAGLGVAPALAPFISLTGDMYETGSILITSLMQSLGAIADPAKLRSDDLLLLVQALGSSQTSALEWVTVVLGALLGVVIAFVIYGLGAAFAARISSQDQLS